MLSCEFIIYKLNNV